MGNTIMGSFKNLYDKFSKFLPANPVRICKRCGNNLDFDKTMLERFVACPFCGTFFPKELPSIEADTIEAELKRIADDFGGLEIFDEENSSRFAKSLMKLSAPFDVARDKLLVANIRKIPQKLYSTLELTSAEQQQMTDLCIDELASFGFPEKLAEEVVTWIVHVLQMPVMAERKITQHETIKETIEIKKKPKISTVTEEKHIEDKTKVVISYKDGKKEYWYKTRIIGSQEWFAENFHEKYGKNGRYDTSDNEIGKNCEIEMFGRLYNRFQAIKNAPDGWRLPTIEDFQDLASYIQELGYDVGTALKAKNQWIDGSADEGQDVFGFCACPTIKGFFGDPQAWFWTSTQKKGKPYPCCCVKLSANQTGLDLTSGANENEFACVRYVRDLNLFRKVAKKVAK